MKGEFIIYWIICLFNYYLCEVAFEWKFSLIDAQLKINGILLLFFWDLKLQKIH